MANLLLVFALGAGEPEQGSFVDVTASVGLGPEVIGEAVARVCFVDFNDDTWPDVVIDRHRVFLNVADETSPIGRRFEEVPAHETNLLGPVGGTLVVFADLDNDGQNDAITTEYIDTHNEKWVDHGRRTRWQRGRGDGTFEDATVIEEAMEATTCAIAVADVDFNGALDLALGNWYVAYGEGYEGYDNEILYQRATSEGRGWFSFKLEVDPRARGDGLEEDSFGRIDDSGGRPTYGIMCAELDNGLGLELIELNYGRRWNRLWNLWSYQSSPRSGDSDSLRPRVHERGVDIRIDGDSIRHGRYPDWLKERGRTDRRFDREDEKPFRANGNSFDCAVGDVDNDLDLDLFLAEITHGWAGDSSDRSRFLLNRISDMGVFTFEYEPNLSVDRIPADVNNWNQGDLFCELADLNHDTRLDLILSSGDYPDDERLRVFLQQDDGSFLDSTSELGVDHDGSQQISLADVDHDGDLDILAGQTFNRFKPEQKEGRTPQARLFINDTSRGGHSLSLLLEGDGEAVNRNALGAEVVAELSDDLSLRRPLIGIGGHAGKQHEFIVHFGLGDSDVVRELTVIWSGSKGRTQTLRQVEAGRYRLRYNGELERLEE